MQKIKELIKQMSETRTESRSDLLKQLAKYKLAIEKERVDRKNTFFNYEIEASDEAKDLL